MNGPAVNGQWPQQGRCGACGRPAQRFPSLRWEHHGRPCALRSRTIFAFSDDTPPCVFVPDGEELPQPGEHRLAPIYGQGERFPSAVAVELPRHRQSRWDLVRARLAADAEARS